MLRQLKRWLAAAAGTGIVTLGMSAVAAPPAYATSGVTQAGPFEVGNLLDYANSDFEGTTGAWMPVSNAMLSDSSASFLHGHSLLDAVPAAGRSTFKLGDDGAAAVRIPVTGGETYTVGAYFKIPAVTGQSLTFALAFFGSSGNWLGWGRTGSLRLNSSGTWQYVAGQITAPPGAASVIGSPEVTCSNVSAHQAIFMDEAAFVPYRAAQIIGAHGPSPSGRYTASDWITANHAIGPLQSDKEFWRPSKPLPGMWQDPGNDCYEIEQTMPEDPAGWPACVIAYKHWETEPELASFLKGMPATQMVIMVYWQEPERTSFSGCPGTGTSSSSGQEFVCLFDRQSDYVRQAAAADGRVPEVFVAMDAGTSQYSSGVHHHNGTDCSYIPPPSYTDFYLADHYYEDISRTGNVAASLPDESSYYGADWRNWLRCVQGSGKPLGLAEYGLNCASNPDSWLANDTAMADGNYLAAIPGATQPTIMWGYWYSAHGFTTAHGCEFTSPAAVSRWRSLETQNGGG